ncbi:hypothetical protein D3C71_1603600 [compost metagenome]
MLAVAPVLDVELLLRHVQRATINVLAAFAPLLVQVLAEVVHELELLVQVLIAVHPRRKQQGGNTDFVEICLQVAPVAVGRLETETADDSLRLQPRIQSHAALGRDFSIAGIKEVAIQLEGWVIQFKGGGTGVLQADDVGILCLQPTEQTTLDCSLNTIDVHTDDPHKWPQKSRACMIHGVKLIS